jgi:hypothetical protein
MTLSSINLTIAAIALIAIIILWITDKKNLLKKKININQSRRFWRDY